MLKLQFPENKFLIFDTRFLFFCLFVYILLILNYEKSVSACSVTMETDKCVQVQYWVRLDIVSFFSNTGAKIVSVPKCKQFKIY